MFASTISSFDYLFFKLPVLSSWTKYSSLYNKVNTFIGFKLFGFSSNRWCLKKRWLTNEFLNAF